MSTESLWKATDVAAYLGISRQRLYVLDGDGAIPVIRLGKQSLRFDPQAVRAWALARQENTPQHAAGGQPS